MNLTCPQCKSEDTQKLSLVMSQGGMAEKSAKMGVSYGLNIMLPMMTFLIAALIGFMFMFIHFIVGVAAFFGVAFAGFKLRSYLKGKSKSKYADLPADMKQSGFQCNRCEYLFIPARAASA